MFRPASDPTLDRSASASRDMNPAAEAAATPTMMVLIQGVLNFLCTVASCEGSRPSLDMV